MSQFNFLQTYIAKLTASTKLQYLSEEGKKKYLPELEKTLEERIGLELIPRLESTQIARLTELMDGRTVNDAEWKTFWETAIPNLEEVLKNILTKFANETRAALI